MCETFEILDGLAHIQTQGLEVCGPWRWVKCDGRWVLETPVRERQPAPKFRAKNEAAWARVFDALGVEWKYEALEPDISRAIRYMPDFWLPEQMVWIEIKSSPPTPGEIRLARDLFRASGGQRVYILSGWPGRGRFSLSLFSEAGDFRSTRPDYCLLGLGVLFDKKFSELEQAFRRSKQ